MLSTGKRNAIKPRASQSEQRRLHGSNFKLPLWGHAQECGDTEEGRPHSSGHGEGRARSREVTCELRKGELANSHPPNIMGKIKPNTPSVAGIKRRIISFLPHAASSQNSRPVPKLEVGFFSPSWENPKRSIHPSFRHPSIHASINPSIRQRIIDSCLFLGLFSHMSGDGLVIKTGKNLCPRGAYTGWGEGRDYANGGDGGQRGKVKVLNAQGLQGARE